MFLQTPIKLTQKKLSKQKNHNLQTNMLALKWESCKSVLAPDRKLWIFKVAGAIACKRLFLGQNLPSR